MDIEWSTLEKLVRMQENREWERERILLGAPSCKFEIKPNENGIVNANTNADDKICAIVCVCLCSTISNCCAWLPMLWCPFLLLLSQLLSFASGFRPVYCLVFGRSIHVIACFSFDSFTLFWAEKKISLDFLFLLKFNSPFRYAVNMFLTHYTGCISSPVTISFMEK